MATPSVVLAAESFANLDFAFPLGVFDLGFGLPAAHFINAAKPDNAGLLLSRISLEWNAALDGGGGGGGPDGSGIGHMCMVTFQPGLTKDSQTCGRTIWPPGPTRS